MRISAGLHFVMFLLVTMVPGLAVGQATFSGAVVGPKGERVAKAAVVIDRGDKKCALQADELGNFELSLAPGSYSFHFESPVEGFKKLEWTGFVVSGPRPLSQDFALEYGRCSDCFWQLIQTEDDVRLIPREDPKMEAPVVVTKPEAIYSDEARKHKIEGSVVLDVRLSSAGTISRIHVDKALPYGLTENAIAAARKAKVSPARFHRIPVAVQFELVYDFSWRSVACSSLAN